MKKLWAHVITSWQSSLLLAVACLVIICLYTVHLGQLTNGFHAVEIISYHHVPSFSSLLKEPVNVPYYLVRNIFHKLGVTNRTLLTRGISVLFGLTAVLSFFGLMRRWYSPLIAGLAAFIFAVSHVILRSSRLGIPIVTQLLPLMVFAIWIYLAHSRYRRTLFVLFILAGVGLVYTPGMIWLLLAGLIWQWRNLRNTFKNQPLWLQIMLVIIAISCLIPFSYGLVKSPPLVWSWLDIQQPFSLGRLWLTARQLPGIIAFHSLAGPLLTVGRAPLLDVFSLFLVVIGFYSCGINWGLDRSRLTVGLLLLAVVRAVIGGPDALVFLLIPLYFLIAEGLAYLLTLWFAVFPRNPLARGVATTLIVTALGLVAYYHVTNYFIAWPKAPSTKAVFTEHL